MQRTLDGHRNLPGDLFEKVCVGVAEGDGFRLPNPIAPRRRLTVVKGSRHTDWTPIPRSAVMPIVNRVSSASDGMINGCWWFQTQRLTIPRSAAQVRQVGSYVAGRLPFPIHGPSSYFRCVMEDQADEIERSH